MQAASTSNGVAGRIGRVSELVDDERLLARAVEIASSIAANGAFGVWMIKRGRWTNVEGSSLQAVIELENRTQILARGTGEHAARRG
jgi:enoyl-CoA hydratase